MASQQPISQKNRELHGNYLSLENFMDITVIRAGRGDCIWIRWEDQCVHNIIIDSGPAATKAIFRRLIQQEITSKGEAIDLLVLTHIDDDHIRGFLYYL